VDVLQNYSEMDHRLVTAVLHIDRQMPVKQIKMLKKQLSCNNLLKIGYRVLPSNLDNCSKSIPYAILVMLPPCSFSAPIQNEQSLPIKLTSKGIYIDKQSQEWHDLEFYLHKFIVHHPDYLIFLETDDDCIYDDYIRFYSTVFTVVSNLRDDKSVEEYKILFDELTFEQQDEIRKRYGVRIYEQNIY
jgi:hypothetical protein